MNCEEAINSIARIKDIRCSLIVNSDKN